MIKLDQCPKAGEGVNRWVNIQVLRMLRYNYTNAEIYTQLIVAAQGCGRDIRNDITHSIDTGRMYLGIGKGFGESPVIAPAYNDLDILKDLPPVDLQFQKSILEQNQEINLSNWPEDKRIEYKTMDILYDLFGSHRICIGYQQNHSIITELTDVNSVIRFASKRINLGLCQFIVPTPMVGDYAINKTGKRAVRCLKNTGQRWFLVIEFDHTPSQDDQIRLHFELAKYRELRMLIFSGNKSIHGWYDVYQQPKKESKEVMKTATRLGADPMTWIRCQYVRFPGGINSKTRTRQEIIYYNYGK